MGKKWIIWAAIGLMALPASALAGGGGGYVGGGGAAAALERKIDDLTRELDRLRGEMSALKEQAAAAADSGELAKVKGDLAALQEKTDGKLKDLDDQAEKWNLAARFQLFGDFRFRTDMVTAKVQEYWAATDLAKGIGWFVDPDSMAPGNATAIANASAQGTQFGTVGLLTGMFMGLGMDAATAQANATGAMNNIIYGNPAGGATPLSAIQRVQNLVAFMKTFSPTQRTQLFQALGYDTIAATDHDNDTIYTNRFRLNMRVKATEDLEFKGRLAMYKAWGMQTNPTNFAYGIYDGPFKLSSVSMDGNRARVPDDSVLRVDRAMANWNNIGGLPMWFSVGRRPTTGGPPNQLRLGLDKRMATPTAFMDYAFDGLTLGYAYTGLFGMDWPGRIRFCYGRGFEAGPNPDGTGLDDVDFAGISWDVYSKGDRFFTFQSFGAFNMMNVPEGVVFNNPLEQALIADGTYSNNRYDSTYANGILDTANLGNIFHTTAVYMDKVQNISYFLGLGWSRTDPDAVDEMGVGLLSNWWDENYKDSKNGYSIYVGGRYDIKDLGLKIGAEYNYGSKNWIAFTPAHDDLYSSKLAVRGHAAEVYMIWDIPAGEAISKYAKSFVRLGYQRHWYNYTGSGFWLGEPQDIDVLMNDPLYAQFYAPIDTLDQVYFTFEMAF